MLKRKRLELRMKLSVQSCAAGKIFDSNQVSLDSPCAPVSIFHIKLFFMGRISDYNMPMIEPDEAQTMLIGTLPDHVPLQDMIPLADSILASPILTVVVDNQTENGDMLVNTLLERGGENLDVVPLNGRNPLSLYPGFAEDPETPDDAALFLEHGVPGILLSLWLNEGQTMAETITHARAYRQAVLDAIQD